MRRIIGLAVLLAAATGLGAAPPDYAEHVAPIFHQHCVECHNATEREGKLSLETYADLVKGGRRGSAIVPGDSGKSLLIRLVEGKAKPVMPPPKTHEPLPVDRIAVLRAWIDAGASGPASEPGPRQLTTPKLPPAQGVAPPITALAWSPDGQIIAVARFGVVELRDAASSRLVRKLEGHPGKVNALRFSTDGSFLVCATGVEGLAGQARLWNVADGQLVRTFDGHRDVLYAAVLSPDGAILATAGYDKLITLWDARTGEPKRKLDGHTQAVYDLAFSPDGQLLASASADQTVKIWQVASGVRLDTLNQPLKEQYAVGFSPDGRFVVAGGADNRLRLWRVISRDRPQINPLLHARFAHEGTIVALAFSRDGSRLVSAAEDRSIKLWDTATLTQLHLWERQPDVPAALALDPAGQRLAVGRLDGSFHLYPVPSHSRETASPVQPVPPADVDPDRPMASAQEAEPNDTPADATPVTLPVAVEGVIHASRPDQKSDADFYRFEAKAGQQWVLEIDAARSGSPLDSKIEVLDSQGRPIERVLLQAVRDSYFTFRGKDSDISDDFRVHNWQEMEVNDYLYAQGEVVKLWRAPRGPDSGFQVYPGQGKRRTYFDTTPLAHALGEPCYIVVPHPPGSKLVPTGLPVFPIYYENDDDGERKLGRDSRLTFTAPADGSYLVRVTDVRRFHGPEYRYRLTIRPRRPDFAIRLEGMNPTVGAGSGQEFVVVVDRQDGFEGEVRIDISDLPPGFVATTPLVVEAGQDRAFGVINAEPDAPPPTPENARQSKVTATAIIDGREVTKPPLSLGQIKLGPKPKLLVKLLPAEGEAPAGPWELTIAPGQTVRARVRVERDGFDGRVEFGTAPGSNLAHGVYVDNIGLNGLLIPEGQTERVFFLTASRWVPESTRTFHLVTRNEGKQASWPIIVHVRRTGESPGSDQP
ncbi:MAG: hypothetical protein NZ700_12200 [Gemmataceae bacterium]|nr:hypothetical protein [Gemmataceae bacterium]MDW8265004.1 c-type cytochrome domain-containing protein [Gemmataceae bacterium]